MEGEGPSHSLTHWGGWCRGGELKKILIWAILKSLSSEHDVYMYSRSSYTPTDRGILKSVGETFMGQGGEFLIWRIWKHLFESPFQHHRINLLEQRILCVCHKNPDSTATAWILLLTANGAGVPIRRQIRLLVIRKSVCMEDLPLIPFYIYAARWIGLICARQLPQLTSI